LYQTSKQDKNEYDSKWSKMLQKIVLMQKKWQKCSVALKANEAFCNVAFH